MTKESIVSDISDPTAVRRVWSVKVDLEVRMIGNDTNGFNTRIPVSLQHSGVLYLTDSIMISLSKRRSLRLEYMREET